MRAVVLAGGRGTRLRPITSVLPKPLIPVGNYPILEILVRQLKKSGYDHITLATGYMSNLIRAAFQDGSRWGVHLDYSEQKKVLGTAAPLTLIKDLNDDFLVLNGDLLTNVNFKKMMIQHKKSSSDVTIGVYQRNETIDLGILDVKYGRIKNYIEKPIYHYNVSSGIYILNKSVLGYLKYNEYCDFPKFIKKLILAGKKIKAYKFKDDWFDLGRPDDYYKACEIFEKNPAKFIPTTVKSHAKRDRVIFTKVKKISEQ